MKLLLDCFFGFELLHVLRFVAGTKRTLLSDNEIQSYDYIIVGGGTSGLVVANRLSEDPDISVLVIENGPVDKDPATLVPYLSTALNTADLYGLTSAPQAQLNNLTFTVLVGNVVGGGTIVNGMAFDRGTNEDYDAWEKLGNKGWGWSDLASYFKKTNHFTPPSETSKKGFNITYDASAYGNGPVQVSIASYQYPDITTVLNSFRDENIPMPEEGFSRPLGAYWVPNDIDNATSTRCHAGIAYYDPIQTRPNLKLLTLTQVTKVILSDDLQAIGVETLSHTTNTTSKFYASNEVILAAGGVFTPHILLLSGIGPLSVLEAANINQKVDLPSVGTNFQDHPSLTMLFNISNAAWPNPATITTNATFNASAAVQYAATHEGPYSVGRSSGLAELTLKQLTSSYQTIASNVSAQDALQYLPPIYSQYPELLAGFHKQRELLVEAYLGDTQASGELPIKASGTSIIVLQKPLSRGTVTLNTTNPHAYPIIQWNALQNPMDSTILLSILRWNRRRWSHPFLVSRYNPIEAAPGAQYQTDDEILQQAITTGALTPTFAHTSGGCPLMPREIGGCVDTELRVYGVKGLRVVDASLFPLIPATHLQATVYAVAERAADIIKSG